MNKLEKIIKSSNFYILRNKYTNKPLALSMTKDGFLYSFNKMGKSLAYRDVIYKDMKILIKDKRLKKDVFIEKYIPNLNDTNPHLKEELLWFNKAKYLC